MERVITEEELKTYDGREGRSAYVAYMGVVYDVSGSAMWKNGLHARKHQAGCDLSAAMAGAPHGEGVFERYPRVGVYAAAAASETARESEEPNETLVVRLRRWNGALHPHQVSVHFPIALHYFSAFFNLLFLLSPSETYADTVFSSFAAATVMGLFALLAGVFSWWVKYGFENSPPFRIKLAGACATLVLGIVPIAQKLENPMVPYSSGTDGVIYHFIIFFTTFTVSVVGYYGGKITWGGR